MRSARWKRGLKLLPFGVVFIIAFGFLVMYLWNWLMPGLFGWKAIGFWQAWGLLILSRILVGGIRGGSHGGNWRHRMMERCEKMTPEERERFRQAMESRWGRVPPAGAQPSA
jgi:hypothetical protein